MKNMKKTTYIESEIDKFLEKCEYKNISASYDNDDGDKIKIDTEKITNHLKNYEINLLILTNLMKSIINLRMKF